MIVGSLARVPSDNKTTLASALATFSGPAAAGGGGAVGAPPAACCCTASSCLLLPLDDRNPGRAKLFLVFDFVANPPGCAFDGDFSV